MYFYGSVKDEFPFGENLNGFSNFILTKVIFNGQISRYTVKNKGSKKGFNSSAIVEPFLVLQRTSLLTVLLKQPFFLNMKNIFVVKCVHNAMVIKGSPVNNLYLCSLLM